ncbi:hypothetical protein CEW92_01135 [Bacillaceae bacterium SAS-127]|nr:hypothetical protein CEW92_01135 [Bacillaceae bacterium SAS-127]
MEHCPICSKNDQVNIEKKGTNCLCDRDFCVGQRCGASDMTVSFKCNRCEGHVFNSKVYESYVSYHCG